MTFGLAGEAILALLGIPAALAALYLLLLAVAAGRLRGKGPLSEPTLHLVVVVPAHDEAELVGRCVKSLLAQDYPRALFRVVVVADNCSDATAAVARTAGAEVLVRDDPAAPGKGRALRWAVDRLLVTDPAFEAVVVVDADSIAEANLVRSLEAGLVAGNEVVQGEYLVLRDGSPRTELLAAGFLLFHRVRFAGRAALGLACNLVGNGMAFSRALLVSHPWNAFTAVEDLEYSLNLRLGGVRPAFAPAARVYGPMPGGTASAHRQRLRWEGGRFFVVRHYLPKLVRQTIRSGDWSLLDAALDLAVPPLGLLVLATVAGTVGVATTVAVGLTLAWAVVPWILALLALPLYVVVGLRAAAAPASTYRALLTAPSFLVRKIAVYARLSRGHSVEGWERSERPNESRRRQSARLSLIGVPIDPVTMDEAVDRVISSAGDRPVSQVCTINLDFLSSAQTDPEVRSIFQESSLNVADGAPIVWLGRLLGRAIPERVAGADLVPRLMARAAQTGTSVFLLGGERGVGLRAARILRERHPGLIIAGVYEPARSTLESMDHEGMVRRINAVDAGILLVAFGHPKQDKWIFRNRERLSVGVAIGVGQCLDLIAGQVRRAPRWMQRAGLEWLYRVGQEPGRLARRYLQDSAWLVRMVPIVLRQRLRQESAESPATGPLALAGETTLIDQGLDPVQQSAHVDLGVELLLDERPRLTAHP